MKKKEKFQISKYPSSLVNLGSDNQNIIQLITFMIFVMDY